MTIDPQAILNIPMQQNDAGATTVRGYLVALAREVWTETDGFSGKRPFGNSGWEHEVYSALAKTGHIEGGVVGVDGWLYTAEQRNIADELIYAALDELADPVDPAAAEAPMAELHEPDPTVLTAAQQIRLETVRMVLGDLQATVGDGAEGAYTLRNLVSDVLLVARVIETGQEPLPAPRAEPVPPVQADGTADEEAAE
jgi:hypothetical protein